jgi:hypothetical protein
MSNKNDFKKDKKGAIMKSDFDKSEKKFPKGHFVRLWMGIGVAIFSGLSILLSIIIDNFGFIGIGPAIGLPLGLAVGKSIENKYYKEGRIRPLTEMEEKKQKIAVIIGLAAFVIGVLFFLLM